MKSLRLFWLRTFFVIPTSKAIELGLTHLKNVYGDEINHINCRSIWIDKKLNKYRVEELFPLPDINTIIWHTT